MMPHWTTAAVVLVTGALIGIVLGWRLQMLYQKGAASAKDPLHVRYLEGINYFLSEKQDEALALFSQMLKADSDAIELYITLGNLYRKRGEIDRAIQMHQALMARVDLPSELRHRASLELAEDYLSAGLLGHAEKLFLQVSDYVPLQRRAWQGLMGIYEQEHEWERAIEIAIALQKKNWLKNAHTVLAHLHCELAEQQYNTGQLSKAASNVKKARHLDSECIRTHFIEADIAMVRGQIKKSLKALHILVAKDIACLPIVLSKMRACYHLEDNELAYENYIAALCEEEPMPPAGALLERAEMLKRHQGPVYALTFLAKHLKKESHPKVLGWVIENLNEYGLIADLSGKFHRVRGWADGMKKTLNSCRCRQCGFTASSLFWRCPGCQTWGDICLGDGANLA